MNFQQHRALMESEEVTDPTEFGVLVSLISFADKVEARCWAGKAKIATRARLKVTADGKCRGLDNAINRLIAKGHISIFESGGGAGNENGYEVHIGGKTASETRPETPVSTENWERGIAVENPVFESQNPAFDDINPAFDAGFIEETPHLETSNCQKTPHLTTRPIAKTPHLETSHIGSEVKRKRNEELCGGGRGTGEVSPSPPPPQNNLIFQAVFEVNGKRPDPENYRDRIELEKLASLLQSEGICDENEAAAEIRANCQFWPRGRTPPHLSQIVKEWHTLKINRRNHEQPQNATPIPQTANERRLAEHVRQRLERRDSGAPERGAEPNGGNPDASLVRLAQRR